jgi:hypothetical protein
MFIDQPPELAEEPAQDRPELLGAFVPRDIALNVSNLVTYHSAGQPHSPAPVEPVPRLVGPGPLDRARA